MVAQQVAGSAVGIVFQCVGGVTADDAPQDGVGILCGQRVLASDLRSEAVGRDGVGLAVGRADAGGVQQADGADLVPQGHEGALGGGIVGRRHEDVEPAVAEAGFHAVLPALVLDAQQFAEDLGVRRHAAALELSVHGVPHSGGGVAVGVDPPASRDGGQLRLLFLYFGGEGVGALPCGEILLFQRLFQPGEGALELRQSLRRQ